MGTASFLEILGGIAVVLVVVIGVVVIVRNLWLTITNPNVAYLLGRKTRKTIEGAAHTAGRATGAADGVAGVIGRSFREGRDLAKGKGGTPEGDA
ncbi:hypothetical protein [Pseudoxanthomonas mexicana]|uniref:hypothetical protein n=1 Tax=Pseudoxanthomonas mexicana TaxID=128785 RepID=UPI0022F3CDCA|nr:hypothetical protein [Pseudoxanthomonas mexicana]WBX94541.1 hypothetical protein PE064_04950 [Pseudoxanthomonas mexicana]